MKVTTLILAGSRAGQDDEVAKAAGVCCKAFAEVGGIAMIERVITALQKSGATNKIIISLPDDVPPGENFGQDVTRISSAPSPVRSILKALDVLEEDTPFLITTADHALLSVDMVNNFLNQYDPGRFDIAAAMLPLDLLTKKYPDMKRTRLRFKDGNYKSCNLFLFKNKRAARNILQFWQEIETYRKTPWKMVRALGVGALLRYITGTLSLEEALAHLGRGTGTTPQAVMLDIPEAAIDVDTPGDLEFCRSIARGEKAGKV